MAQKRMFDKSITSDDIFLEMPIGSQLLYFHLSMNADDDGFINNWKSIMKMIGAKEDDLKVLLAKSYILPFESGVIVIKHWKINNYLRNDRYKPTRFKEEASKLIIDNNSVYQWYSNGIPSIDKNSIDKNSIDKNSIDIPKQLENKSDVKMYDRCTTDVANIKDRVITRVKDITRNINNTPNTLTSITPKNEIKKNYGKYQRIKLSDNEVKKLIEDFGKEIVKEKIEQLDEYVEINNNKNKYKNFNLVIRKAIKENWFDKKSSSKEYKSEFMKGIEKYASDDFEPNLNILPEFRKEDYE